MVKAQGRLLRRAAAFFQFHRNEGMEEFPPALPALQVG
jgi:hypothetical protein